MAGQIHDQFEEVHIHTAKCDICENHNKSILYRCLECSLSVCTPCNQEDPGDGRHYMNGGRAVFAASSAELLPPAPPSVASAPYLHPETAEPAQTKRQRDLPRPSRKRERPIVEETDDEHDEEEEEIPDPSRKGKKRQKTQRFETRSSTSKRRRAETSPVVRTEKKRRVNYEIGKSSRQAIERKQPERETGTTAHQASDNRLDAEATLLGFGQHGAAFIAALKARTRNSNPDERNLTMLAMVADVIAGTEDNEDEEGATAQLQIPDSETEGGQDAQAHNPIFFTEADGYEVDLEPQVVAPLTDSEHAECVDDSGKSHLLTEDSQVVVSQCLVDKAIDGISATKM